MGSRALKNRRGTKRKHPIIGFLYALAILVVLVIAACVGVYSVCQSWLEDLPDYTDSSYYELSQKTQVYASDGKTLLAEFYLEDREPVEQDEISDYVWQGTVDTEDVRFYNHNGVDMMGILRAVFVNITGLGSEGASTITQQLVRNTVLSSEASESTLKRKIREAYIAIKLEEIYSKDEILLMYLNTINYGSGTYGIQAAAQKYFSKDASDLTIAEAATLIGIPNSPTEYNPIDHPDACKDRRNVVLARMLSNGTITQEEYDKAIDSKLKLNVSDSESQDGIYKYPYFTSYVRDTLLDMYPSDTVYTGGLKVYTTLEVDVQKAAVQAARNKEATVDDDLEVAITVIDPDTDYISAIVGGKDYYTDQYNLATQATRQPGSTFKTFTLLACIEEGLDPNNTNVKCNSTVTLDNWTVSNINKNDYGTRTVASAFAKSSNTGFARLCTWVGADKVVDMAQRCGITSDLYAVPSITLGSYEVTTVEMADAYATIANGGTHHEARCISKIEDSNGDTIYKADTEGEQVIDTEVAMAAEEVMEGVLSSEGTGSAAQLSNGQAAAGKTGTSEEYRDSWFVGFTPQYSVAIWMGGRDEAEMSSSTSVADVFSDLMDTVLADQEVEEFPEADDPDYEEVTDSDLGISPVTVTSTDDSASTSSSSSSSTSTSTSTSASIDADESDDGDADTSETEGASADAAISARETIYRRPTAGSADALFPTSSGYLYSVQGEARYQPDSFAIRKTRYNVA